MPITIDGTGSISGLSAGGLPDASVVTADLAAGAVTQAKRSEDLTLGTAQASTSGTSIDFTGIPSWVKRVTVMFQGVSTSGTSAKLVQLGAGSVTATGYLGGSQVVQQATGFSGFYSTAGVPINSVSAADTIAGNLVFNLLGSNAWSASGTFFINSSPGQTCYSAGSVTLSGTLDRIRITTVNGTDTFDAGSINILYE